VHVTDLPTPKLRGWLHQLAFFASIPAGIALVALASVPVARVGAMVFAGALTGLYGVSAAYHRRHWSANARRIMRYLDHSMIFVLIAGTYTPVTLLALGSAWGITLLSLVWSGAIAGILVTVLHFERLHRLGFAMYLVLGWLAIVAAPELVSSLSRVELALLLIGGILYTVGAIILGTKRPDPHPTVFGYHELWHTCVVGATACHFVLVLLLVRA
jgi:hemolysin III